MPAYKVVLVESQELNSEGKQPRGLQEASGGTLYG